MNDRNEEEPARYQPPASCHYFVLSLPAPPPSSFGEEGEEEEELTPLQTHVLAAARSGTARRLHCEALIDARRSPSVLARAFEVPLLSKRHNKFVEYCLFKNNATEKDRASG
jgi:hypothetical protein